MREMLLHTSTPRGHFTESTRPGNAAAFVQRRDQLLRVSGTTPAQAVPEPGRPLAIEADRRASAPACRMQTDDPSRSS
ncbi:hypothetical protein [Dactylosporangium salmoneum]|uniref:hypothetical protein n=1 Tax=Dactylosporangium salmoneum TaxID=53361 RepID=UPI0031DEBE2E